MRIAVIGSGISGLGAAWLLAPRHEVHLFESRPRLGGHTHTVLVERPEGRLSLDTGFMIFNRASYPLLTRLFSKLGVPSQPTDMSFSVQCDACSLSYAGRGFRGLFAQRRNAVRPAFLRMLNDIGRLARRADSIPEDDDRTLDTFLREESYGQEFTDHYILPMAAALWSSGPGVVRRFPIRVLLEFFRNHGLLRLRERLDWQTIPGGSATYVRAIRRSLRGSIHLNAPVSRVTRGSRNVEIRVAGRDEQFDHVVLATHADQALSVLHAPTPAEQALLSAWTYESNDTWLHTDEDLLPASSATHSAWNYRVKDCSQPRDRVTATYGLNRLQRIDSSTEYMVTLNPMSPPRPEHVIQRMNYRHPMMTPESTSTWGDLPTLNGNGRVSFCGSYFGYGFHEDGFRSAVSVAESLGTGGP